METRLCEVGARLLKARQESGYTQEDLAERIGCCLVSVSRWENGLRPMKTMDIINATEVLQISADYLLGTIKPEIRGMEKLEDLSVEKRKIVETVLEALLDVLTSTERLLD